MRFARLEHDPGLGLAARTGNPGRSDAAVSGTIQLDRGLPGPIGTLLTGIAPALLGWSALVLAPPDDAEPVRAVTGRGGG
ncbi:MAG: hypothetical protein ACOC5E_03550 [Acidobacteriota bacterium]